MDKKKIILLSAFGAAVLGIIFIPGFIKMRNLAQENRRLEQQIAEIRQSNQSLQEQQQMLKNDPLYLEKIAREKLGVARKGEVVYRVLPPQENQ
ncbi:MAG: septum formation initiator family protein [Candidatus Omnitrophica bacterium]|nr:septum formation initiator family protein [Candidatus Omnitrophota bacterium]